MGSIRYGYKNFPDCPKATKYSKEREENSAVMTSLSGVFVLIALVYFFINTLSFFDNYNWSEFLQSIVAVGAGAFWTFYLIFLRPTTTNCELEAILAEEMHKDMQPDIIASRCKELREESKKEKLDATKAFVKGFVIALFSAIALIGAIKGVYFLCHKRDGLLLLLCSLGALVISSLIAYCVFVPQTKTEKKFPLAQRETAPNVPEAPKCPDGVCFCHKCGAKILPDSMFCATCGNKVR